MRRQAIDGGGWFDVDRARRWDEGTTWDGRNRISMATGSQWRHEALYLTAKGAWVLHRWSQVQGEGESWQCVTQQTTAEWLVENGHGDDAPAEERDAAEV